MLPSWVAQYVGLEYEDRGRGPKFDCWGLVKEVFKAQFHVEVPSYVLNYDGSDEEKQIGPLIDQECLNWLLIPAGQQQLGDVIVIRILRYPCHVGIVLDSEKFLHIIEGTNACVARYTDPTWNKRIIGFYRHKEMVA